MKSRWLRGLTAVLWVAAAPTAAQAQFVSTMAGTATARAALLREETHPPAIELRVQASNTRGPVIGFVVGAALGAAAGYGAFNGLCEAVDNRCEGSRPLWMTVGGLAFGGLGALVGMLID